MMEKGTVETGVGRTEATVRPLPELPASSLPARWPALDPDAALREVQAATSLRADAERWRTVSDFSPDYVAVLDEACRIRYVNRAAPPYRREELVGADALEMTVPENREALRDAVDRVFAGEPHVSFLSSAVLAHGERWFSNRAAPVIRDGVVTAAIIIASDITETYLAEEGVTDVDLDAAQALGAEGTVLLVAIGGKWAGSLVAADPVRPEAGEAVAMLRGLGHEPWLVTGDRVETAEAVAAELGIGQVRAHRVDIGAHDVAHLDIGVVGQQVAQV